MFNVKADPHRKGNRNGKDRLEFLQKLVTEFQETDEDGIRLSWFSGLPLSLLIYC